MTLFPGYALALEYVSLGETAGAIPRVPRIDSTRPEVSRGISPIRVALYCKVNSTAKAKTIYRQGIELAVETNDIHAKTEMEEELEDIEDEW